MLQCGGVASPCGGIASQHGSIASQYGGTVLHLITASLQAAPHLMSVTGKCVYVLDIKTFAVKSRIELSDLESVSLSAHSDGTCVLHIDQVRLLVNLMVYSPLTGVQSIDWCTVH